MSTTTKGTMAAANAKDFLREQDRGADVTVGDYRAWLCADGGECDEADAVLLAALREAAALPEFGEECPECGGVGHVASEYGYAGDVEPRTSWSECEECGGTGEGHWVRVSDASERRVA